MERNTPFVKRFTGRGGETVLSGGRHPNTELKVCKSNAGYYVGFLDSTGAPYSRESRYFNTRKGAESLLGCLRYRK